MDTVDLSNLNRQFLFSREHIKQPKAIVAAQTASKFNPSVNIVPHFSDIKNTSLFTVEWFRSFDIVYNALDNADARSYVNRMCLVTNTPLIECGTAGYNGQTQPIMNGITECYDCRKKETPKTFAVCTIRSTPSQPIHAIVWAKSFLYSQIFDDHEDDNIVEKEKETVDVEENGESLMGLENKNQPLTDQKTEEVSMNKEAHELKALRDSLFEENLAKRIFDKVFCIDIERLASIDTMWKTRQTPTPMNYDQILKEISELPKTNTVSSLAIESLSNDQSDWTPLEAFSVFSDSISRLQKRILATTNGESDRSVNSIPFDKDDEDTLDFVVAAAQLRSYIFHIPTKSKFEFKQMAGNIIPAIATTNAVIAGLSVIQSIKIISSLGLEERIENSNNLNSGTSHSFVTNSSSSKTSIQPEVLKNIRPVFLSNESMSVFSTDSFHTPNPSCITCGVSRGILPVDPAKTQLRDIVDVLLKENWKYSTEVSIITTGLIYDPDFDDNLDRTLEDLGIKNNSFLTVIDELDDDINGARENLELYIIANHGDEKDNDPKIILRNIPAIPFKEKYISSKSPENEVKSSKEFKDESSKIEISAEVNVSNLITPAGMKRKLESDEETERIADTPKKIKTTRDEEGREIIEIDLGDDGTKVDDGIIELD